MVFLEANITLSDFDKVSKKDEHQILTFLNTRFIYHDHGGMEIRHRIQEGQVS